MLKLKNYKSSIFLNIDNFISIEMELKSYKKPAPITFNYLFNKRLKIIRTFIYFYSLFSINFPFNPIIYQADLEFKLKIDHRSALMLDNDYTDFYYN